MADKDAEKVQQEDLAARNRLHYQWVLDSISKFRLFFTGLTFATLSFSVQFSVASSNRAAKWCQFAAWLLLLAAGALSLRDAGGLVAKYTEGVFDGLPPSARVTMWVSFLLAVTLLMIARFVSGV